MTAQDWWPGLPEDDEESDRANTARRGWWLFAAAGALVVAVGAAVLVRGLHDLPARRSASPTAGSTSSPTASGIPAAADGPLVIEAQLNDSEITGGGSILPLLIGIQPVREGAAPERVPNFDSCQADESTLQYLPVQIRRPENWLSATVEVQSTPTTPADLGRLGFFFQAGEASTPCAGGAWSTSDSFVASNVGQAVITGYVVLDQAVTTATPQGRADVFGTLRLRVSDVRLGDRPLTVGTPTVGSLCPATDDELCAPLG